MNVRGSESMRRVAGIAPSGPRFGQSTRVECCLAVVAVQP